MEYWCKDVSLLLLYLKIRSDLEHYIRAVIDIFRLILFTACAL